MSCNVDRAVRKHRGSSATADRRPCCLVCGAPMDAYERELEGGRVVPVWLCPACNPWRGRRPGLCRVERRTAVHVRPLF
jgi:hypothetical protein